MPWLLHPSNGTKRFFDDAKAAIYTSTSRPLATRWTVTTAPPEGYTPPSVAPVTMDQLTPLLAGKANLSGGKLATSELPPLAIADYLGAAVNQAAMLALVGQRGDWCTRTDTGTTWLITGDTPSSLSSWQQLSYPAMKIASATDLDQTGAAAGRVPAVTGVSGGVPSGYGLRAVAPLLAKTTTKISAYTAAAGELVVADTTGGTFVITVPAIGSSGDPAQVGVRWDAGTVPPTVQASGTDKFGSGIATTATDLLQGETRIWQSEPDATATNRRWRALFDNKTVISQDGRYDKPSSVAPAPTGVAVTDTANLQAAIDATPRGGRLYLRNGTYVINAALSITKNITIEGDAASATYKPGSQGGTSSMPSSPYLAGTIIQQSAAATNIINATTSAVTLNLTNVCLMFASGLASTGHGIYAVPTLDASVNGKDFGLTDFLWQNVYVYGHDGDHYGCYLLNTQYGTANHFRSFGGGGIRLEADLGTINSGNIVFEHPFIKVDSAGTAHGIAHSAAVTSGHPGQLNLIVYIRPQVGLSGAAKTQATQLPWHDKIGAGEPRMLTVYDADFEGLTATNQPIVGQFTAFLGNPLVDGGNARIQQAVQLGQGAGGKLNQNVGQQVAVGLQAVTANATGVGNTGVGYMALSAVTASDRSTGFGNQAAKFQTGAQNTAVGADALLGVSGSSTGTVNTAVGYNALKGLTTGGSNMALGAGALELLTTGTQNVAIGRDTGKFTNGATANAVVAGSNNSFVGYQAGSSSGDISRGTALGYQALVRGNALAIGASAKADAIGAVAIGTDSGGAGAATTVQNEIALGTVNHTTKLAGRLNVAQRTPTTSADVQGQTADIAADDNYVYVKASTGWKRAALATF